MLWRWNVLVLAIKAVLSAELAWSSFIAFLLARTAVVTSLRGADLLSSDLLCCAAICAHVWALGVRINLVAILLSWGRLVKDGSIGVRGANGVVVAIWYAAIWALFWVHGPVVLMAAMLHALSGRLRLDVDADTGGARAVGFRGGSGLRRWRTTVGRDAVLRDCYGSSAGDAMRTLARRGDVPWIRKGANV